MCISYASRELFNRKLSQIILSVSDVPDYYLNWAYAVCAETSGHEAYCDLCVIKEIPEECMWTPRHAEGSTEANAHYSRSLFRWNRREGD